MPHVTMRYSASAYLVGFKVGQLLANHTTAEPALLANNSRMLSVNGMFGVVRGQGVLKANLAEHDSVGRNCKEPVLTNGI